MTWPTSGYQFTGLSYRVLVSPGGPSLYIEIPDVDWIPMEDALAAFESALLQMKEDWEDTPGNEMRVYKDYRGVKNEELGDA